MAIHVVIVMILNIYLINDLILDGYDSTPVYSILVGTYVPTISAFGSQAY